MTNVMLSIIVPAYNVEKYISECVKSIINQSYKNFELIIVNDGSTDNTLQILRKYEALDHRLIILNQNNQGQSSARNRALNLAKGKYIGFIDSDDWIEPEMYENMVRIAEQTNADMIVCDMSSDYEDGTIDYYNGRGEKNKIDSFAEYNNSTETIKYLLTDRLSVSPCNKIYRRKMIEENKLRYPLGLWNEDMEMAVKYYFHSKKIVKVDGYYYHYRQRNLSTTKTYDYRIFDMFKVMDNIYSFLQEKKLNILYVNEYRYYYLYFGVILTFYRALNMENEMKNNALIKIRVYLKNFLKNYKLFIFNSYLSKNQKILISLLLVNIKTAEKLFFIKRRLKNESLN